ncbi:MAG: translocation/assembly module TamB domain-containing protein [Bacteroidaceae bacterium]|nr:translocation/assembly module TamB domain-containing protein [Bacteroidaceae bacterium]
MKKRSRTYRIFKAAAIAVCLPAVLLWFFIILLYVPPVQRYAVDKICKKVGEASGFEVGMGSFHLAFPLKLSISDFQVSRNDTVFLQGKEVEANISFLPLLRGEVEVNYISVEKTAVNTADLIEGVKIDGEIGFFRAVARNIDLDKEIVNLRQLHLHSTDVSITLCDTTDSEDDDEPLNWVINLYKGGIENCSVKIDFPLDTMSIAADIGKLRLREGAVDIGNEIYSVGRLALSNSGARYDAGTESRKAEPLSHIALENINIGCKDIIYSPLFSAIDVERLTFIQPGGIRVTNAAASLTADEEKLSINKLALKSRNGTELDIKSEIPWQSLETGGQERLAAILSLSLDKRDLATLLTEEQQSYLAIFEDDMLIAEAAVQGNISELRIDTLDVTVPSLAVLHASGYARDIIEPDSIEASLDIFNSTGELRKLLAAEENDSITGTGLIINGKAAYKRGTAGADLVIDGVGGRISAQATYDIEKEAYDANIGIAGINVSSLLQDIPLSGLTASLNAAGTGFDIFDEQTSYEIGIAIDTLLYDGTELKSISLNAAQQNSISKIVAAGDANDLKFSVDADTELRKNDIKNKTSIEVSKADFMMLGLTDAELGTEMKLNIEASTDMRESHALRLNGKGLKIITEKKNFTPADISIDFSTTPAFSYLKASNGDLHIDGSLKSGYKGLFSSFDKLEEMLRTAAMEESTLYYLQDYEKALPDITLDFSCGQKNVLHNYLAMKELNVNNMSLTMKLDSIKGININGGVHGFKSGELNLDTIRLFTRQEENKIRYMAGVRSTTLNPMQEKMTFNAMLFGNIFNDSVTTSFVFRDKEEGVGIKFGAKTLVKPKELEIRFNPDAVLFGSKFRFEDNNYIRFGGLYSIDADVAVTDEHDAGMRLTASPDENDRLNSNLELFNVNLKKLTGMMPFVPDIGGMLNLDLFLRMEKEKLLLSSDIRVDSVSYEGTLIGDETLEVVYFPKENSRHYLDVKLSHDNEEVAHLEGDYFNDSEEPGLKGNISLTRFPLAISKAFMKDAGMSLDGYVNSRVNAVGKLSKLDTDGYIQFDSAFVNAPLFGTDLRLSDKPVTIDRNRIQFNGFDIYAKGDSPFKLNGTVDMSKLSNPSFNLRMNANDYELVNAPRRKGSMLYGRMFIDFRAFIGGTLNSMKVYGNATLLGKSNITYVMQDAPIGTDKELDGLVEFVNFSDTTKVEAAEEEEADFGNTNISLGLKIEDGARINADFDANRKSYVTLQGGGSLNMSYTGSNGLNVSGTYTMSDGELKYELPIIPLKTFNITDGSKVTWTGDILDPTIEITALERITTSVSMDDGGSQPVAFDVGVKLSNTLSDMGLTFTISAPENAVVQDQLNSLDTETLNKYAVTMLITGTYIGNSKGMSVTNALNSFIDAKINDLAGSAMKSVSVNVGINDAENAETGGTYKNYSFSFKKRFWNDRLTIVIGGEVNSGDRPAANESFINNVSLEWKISDSSNRYLRLFYDKNYESLLEGEIIETGIGYVYKRKLENLRELFIFKRGKKRGKTLTDGNRTDTDKKKAKSE